MINLCDHYYISCKTLVELSVRKYLGLFRFELGCSPCNYEWKWFAFTYLVVIGKSFPKCVKVVDVGQEDWSIINQVFCLSLNLLLDVSIHSFSLNCSIFPSTILKFSKPFKLLFTPSNTSLRDPTTFLGVWSFFVVLVSC